MTRPLFTSEQRDLMSKQSEYLRDQANRAERLSNAISGQADIEALQNFARQLRADADQVERPHEERFSGD
jgi:hypothetical protein